MRNRCPSRIEPISSPIKQLTGKETGTMEHQHHRGSHHEAQETNTMGHAHDKHGGHTPAMFKTRFFVCLLLTLPVLYFTHEVQLLLGYRAVSFPGAEWVAALLSAVIYFYGGGVFLAGARHELNTRAPGMMTLIALAITVAFGYSLAVTLGLKGMPFYWELATLVDIMLLGHWIEMATVQGASRALEHLALILPAVAHRMRGEQIEEILVSELQTGDLVLVRPGEQVPADGIVREGASSVNEAFLTGESRPVPKEPGSELIAGAVNGEGVLKLEVSRTGEQTALHQIMRLVKEAQSSRSRFQMLADKAALRLTFIAIGAAALTFLIWTLLKADLTFRIERTVTLLVIACPHALGLAIPLVIVNATALAAQNGILVRNREAFERARNLQVVAFDKTGTLTEGQFGLRAVYTASMDENHALQLAANLEALSEHPLAEAIVQEAKQRSLTITPANAIQAVPGKGIEAQQGARLYRAGRPEWAQELKAELPAQLQAGLREADERGESTILLMEETAPVALFALADRVRESAKRAVQVLQKRGIQVVMITGDAQAVAQNVAAELGIKRYYARVLPQQKAMLLREIKEEGHSIAFVGDGINDAPALVEADIGIAIGAGTNVAIEAADLVLVENDPLDVARIFILSRATYNKMVQNLLWATGYNALAMPLAAGVAYKAGLLLSPAVGAIFMSISTVIVAINAMLLRRTDLEGGT